MLTAEAFKFVIQNTPLVSIDLCLICNGQIFLGKRSNEPLKGRWFTPGGRIHKNEPWQDCLRRVTRSEIGFVVEDLSDFRLMGVWDHFYENSVLDKSISTHYVNLPHYCYLKEKPKLLSDEQHDDLAWFDLEEIENNENFHKYMRSYATWLLKNMENTDD